MSDLPRIDDPIDGALRTLDSDRAPLEAEFRDTAINFAALGFPLAAALAVINAVREQLSVKSRFERVKDILNIFGHQLKQIRDRIGKDSMRISKLEADSSTEKFQEAIRVGLEESVRATDDLTIHRIASMLSGFLAGSEWSDANEDLGVLIRNIAQLGTRDIEGLTILRDVHKTVIEHSPNLHDPNPFAKETPNLKMLISKSGIHPDDFLATCERLRGFGLAAEVLRNIAHMGPGDYCYRPTRRGLAVLDYLEATMIAGSK